MGRTLVFCTSYSDSEIQWNNRYLLWLNAIRSSEIVHEHILLVDDASPVLPNWRDLRITNKLLEMPVSGSATLYRFDKRLGRQGRSVYPGWYRSFCLAARFAEQHGFDRVVHIESDGFIITAKMQHFINQVSDDWIAPGILSHNMMPESAIQVMAGKGFQAFIEFTKKPYSDFVGFEAEGVLPFTRVERGFVGSRYGETLNFVPTDADFVTQTNPSMLGNPEYYWWLRPDSFFLGPSAPVSSIAGPNLDQPPRETYVPRIIALSLVKNEQDIIEPFVRHTNNFVDYHVILDNGSIDDTRRILTDLMRELDGVVVTTSSEFGYTQSERMSKLLRTCQTAFFADYVIFLDADEFISCESRVEFERHLACIPVGGYGRIAWRTFVLAPSVSDQVAVDPPRSMPWRRADEVKRDNVVLRLDRKYWHDLVVAQGNHSVSSNAGRSIASISLDGIYLNHFPLRSVNQFMSKSIVGWMAYLAKDPQAAAKGDGYHWRHNFDIVASGKPIDYLTVSELSLRYDHPHRDWDWSKDVVQDVPPDRYVRRYSSGKYGEPLSVVAKSWQTSLQARSSLVTLTRKSVPASGEESSKGATAFDAEWHWANPFADFAPFVYLSEKFKPQTVLDIGCGIGAYLSLFKQLGAKDIFGADGIPGSVTMLTGSEYKEVDLTRPLSLGRKFDLVMCLEVAEHLPHEGSAELLNTLDRHADGLIVFSAGEPGQPGHGHITNLPIEKWLRDWESLGWFPALGETLAMRALSTFSWFKRNIVVLRKGADGSGEQAIGELTRVGSLSFAWHHTQPGVRSEILTEDTPMPPFGYSSEV